MIGYFYDLIYPVLVKGFGYFYTAFKVLVIVYFLLLNFSYVFTIMLSYKFLRKYANRLKSIAVDDMIKSSDPPPITLLVPAYNEDHTIVESVKSLLYLNYPEYEILVINDGSTDQTLEKLKEVYKLKRAARGRLSNIETAKVKQIYQSSRYPELWVIDKENGGKSDALNTGINYCHTPLYCAMDADSLLEKNALIRLVRPFLENKNTVAAGGIIRIANGCDIESGNVKNVRLSKNLLAAFQTAEYLRAYLSGRMGWEVINATLIISGAFGIFKRKTAVQVGGYDTDTVGEDMDLVIKLHHFCRKNDIEYNITYIPGPVAWTEVPQNLSSLGRQRERWQRGLYETITKHKEMLLNPKYGTVGMLAYPYFFFLEMLGPFIEIPGYIFFIIALIFGMVSPVFAGLFLTVTVIFGITLSIISIGLGEITFRRYKNFWDLVKLYGLAVLENFGYRQLNAVWRIKGLFTAIWGKNKSWGEMKRKGFGDSDEDNG